MQLEPLVSPKLEIDFNFQEADQVAATTLNPAVVYLESLGSAVSKAGMVSPLNVAAAVINPALIGKKDAWRFIPWQNMRAAEVRLILSRLKGAPATRNKALAALKGVARSAWELNMMNSEELARIKSIKGDAGTRELAGRFIGTGEIISLLKSCAADGSPAGARDAAMITLAAMAGIRRAELAGMKAENVEHNIDGPITIRIIGKRNKERVVYATGNAGIALNDWLKLRGPMSGPLFCAIRKGGAILPHHEVTPTALDKTLKKRAGEAGVSDVDWHDLRRTTASNLLDAGADIAVVSKILGHSNVQTTARYDRRGERAKIKASELISIPHFQRPNL